MVIIKAGEERPQASNEAEYFNYPLGAVKEAVTNAVYHKCYKDKAPIEVRISPEGMEITSFPGPLPPLDNQKLKTGEITIRKYRNPSLGHFLKQMQLVKGMASGLEKINFLMQNNGNSLPLYKTDKKRGFFQVFLPIHPKFAFPKTVAETSQKPVAGIYEIVQRLSIGCPKNVDLKMAAMVLLTVQGEMRLDDLMFKLSQTNKNRFLQSCIRPLMTLGWLKRTIPDKPNSGKQKYTLTETGRGLIAKDVSSKVQFNSVNKDI